MKKNRNEFLNSMKSQRFGVEIELTGIRIQDVKSILKSYFGDEELFDRQGRDWRVTYDSSINAHYYFNGYYVPTNSNDYRVELITPILEYSDIPMLQEIIRLLRKAEAVAGATYGTGIHIHVCDEGHNEVTLRNLIRLMSSKQYLLQRALQIPDSRLNRYCQYANNELIRRSQKKYKDVDAIRKVWDSTSSRYYMLNLSSMFDGKGIEFRMFNSTLHAGKVKSYIQFSLALCQSAKDLTRTSSYIPKNDENDKYAMRNWLNRMHLVGEEFKTCRKFMCEALSGESSFANPEARKKVSDSED